MITFIKRSSTDQMTRQTNVTDIEYQHSWEVWLKIVNTTLIQYAFYEHTHNYNIMPYSSRNQYYKKISYIDYYFI